MDEPTTPQPTEPGYYVMDRFSVTASAAMAAGPFTTRAEAEHERRQLNIAADCDVMRFTDGHWTS